MSSLSQRRRRRYGRGRGRGNSGRSRTQNNATSPDIIDVESVADSPTCIDLTEGPDEEFVDLTNLTNTTPIIISPSSHSEPSTGPHMRHRRLRPHLPLHLSLSDDSDGDDLIPVPFTLPDLPDIVPSTSGENGTQNRNNPNGDADTSLMSPEDRIITCPVCLDTGKQIKRSGRQIVSTVCGHIFCSDCLKATIQTYKKCPNCRKKLTLKQYHPIFL